jgi:hypothetical protein
MQVFATLKLLVVPEEAKKTNDIVIKHRALKPFRGGSLSGPPQTSHGPKDERNITKE